MCPSTLLTSSYLHHVHLYSLDTMVFSPSTLLCSWCFHHSSGLLRWCHTNTPSFRWKRGDDGRLHRIFDFWQPKRGVCAVAAHVTQTQELGMYSGCVLVLMAESVMQHIPYADAFRVQIHWRVRPRSNALPAPNRVASSYSHVNLPTDSRRLTVLMSPSSINK